MKVSELIEKAIPLVRHDWWQGPSRDRVQPGARGKNCPIIALDPCHSWGATDDDIQAAIAFLDKAAGKPIQRFNDDADNVQQVLRVMGRACRLAREEEVHGY